MRFIAAICCALMLASAAHGRNLGQYAQHDPWWEQQRVPNGPMKGGSCCSTADGIFVQETIEGDDYYVDFVATMFDGQEIPVRHMLVPKDAVIQGPNKFGRAVVWYLIATDTRGTPPRVIIRCFVPGGGV